jgi:tRNA A-37 threonylcarbamoyl transferase component Bud32
MESGPGLTALPHRALHRIIRKRGGCDARSPVGIATVPAVYEITQYNGRSGIVMERVIGPDLLSDVGRRPWRVLNAASMTGRVHAELNRVEAPPSLRSLRDWIRVRITKSNLVPPDFADRALRELDSLPDGDSLCHGDFHPGNILITATGPVVIDWVNATRGDSHSDFARTSLMMRIGALPPGSPRLIVATHRLGRGLFVRGYDRAYRRSCTMDRVLADRWRLVRAVDRLVDDIAEERRPLLDFVRAARVA